MQQLKRSKIMINRHEKLPPLEQIKEHGLDYNHKLIDLANQMYEIGRAEDFCHPEEIMHAFNYVYECLEAIKYRQDAMVGIIETVYLNNKTKEQNNVE
jgi:hypothetical protein